MVKLIRLRRLRGRIIHKECIMEFHDYYPVSVLIAIRDDCEEFDIPRVMISLDSIYGTMEKSGNMEIARQYKFTAPKTRIEYWLESS